MTKHPTRRRILQATMLGALGAPLVARHASAQAPDLAAYQQARINWRQAEGEQITVAVIPASYFDVLAQLTPQFEALSGVRVRYERVPPGQIRQNAMLDLTSRTGRYATSATDPMYYPLYVANRWVDPLDRYLNDAALTDPAWFNYNDIIPGWRNATAVEGKPYGIPYDGEVTVQVYRKDIYAAKGLRPAETVEQFVQNAQATHDPNNRLWAVAMRGFAGAGQNMYIYPSLFRSFGGEWFSQGRIRVNGPEAVQALEWYVDVLTRFAPQAVRNWNWPDIADAFAQGTIGVYIDANTTAVVVNNAERSQVIGKIGFARWPKGPSGRRVTSIWNWGFPINAALSERAKRATWLFIAWATSAETAARGSYKFAGAAKRPGVNRVSFWRNPEFVNMVRASGDNFVESAVESLEQDTDVEWRPRLPQWPAIGDTMATAIQTALAGQQRAKESLDAAQARIEQILRG
jgi:multiple sugar transport system substrate-binding protein